MTLTLPTPDQTTELVVLCWTRKDGKISESMPLAYDRAEAVGMVYAAMHQEESYWIRPLPLSGRRRELS